MALAVSQQPQPQQQPPPPPPPPTQAAATPQPGRSQPTGGRQGRPPGARIRLSRELVLRLSKALGHQEASCQWQSAVVGAGGAQQVDPPPPPRPLACSPSGRAGRGNENAESRLDSVAPGGERVAGLPTMTSDNRAEENNNNNDDGEQLDWKLALVARPNEQSADETEPITSQPQIDLIKIENETTTTTTQAPTIVSNALEFSPKLNHSFGATSGSIRQRFDAPADGRRRRHSCSLNWNSSSSSQCNHKIQLTTTPTEATCEPIPLPGQQLPPTQASSSPATTTTSRAPARPARGPQTRAARRPAGVVVAVVVAAFGGKPAPLFARGRRRRRKWRRRANETDDDNAKLDDRPASQVGGLSRARRLQLAPQKSGVGGGGGERNWLESARVASTVIRGWRRREEISLRPIGKLINYAAEHKTNGRARLLSSIGRKCGRRRRRRQQQQAKLLSCVGGARTEAEPASLVATGTRPEPELELELKLEETINNYKKPTNRGRRRRRRTTTATTTTLATNDAHDDDHDEKAEEKSFKPINLGDNASLIRVEQLEEVSVVEGEEEEEKEAPEVACQQQQRRRRRRNPSLGDETATNPATCARGPDDLSSGRRRLCHRRPQQPGCRASFGKTGSGWWPAAWSRLLVASLLAFGSLLLISQPASRSMVACLPQSSQVHHSPGGEAGEPLAGLRNDSQQLDTQVNPSPSSSSSDELSRAILATMSTQPTPLADLSGGGSNSSSNSNSNGFQLNGLDGHLGSPGGPPPPTPTRTTASHTDDYRASTAAAATPAPNRWLDGLLDFLRIFIMGAIIVGDICGNSLVILSVCRHSKLRVTTNWFVVSLACADILVALFAMTFNASVIISGRWLFKPWVCDFWNSCDVLASTASILHLCCISIDRYIAIMRPLDYPMKITTRRVVYALCAVWISSALLSYIPIFTGIYTTSEHIDWLRDNPDQCDFVVNRVYAIVSSSISFWIPCCIMVFTYYRIYKEASRQEKFIYKAQSMMPAPMVSAANHQHHQHGNNSSNSARSKQRRSKSMAVTGSSAATGSKEQRIRNLARQQQHQLRCDLAPPPPVVGPPSIATTDLTRLEGPGGHQLALAPESEPLTGSAVDLNNNNNSSSNRSGQQQQLKPANANRPPTQQQQQQQQQRANSNNNNHDDDDDDRDSNSGQSTPTKRSISKMKREHKAAKTLGIIMGVFILCWLPFFSWYTPQHICGHACEGMVPRQVVTLLFWIGYFNSTLNPIIYAYFNHEFRDAFKKTLQWIFCCCQDLKCLRVNRPNDNQHYNCTYRSTQEIGLVSSS